MEVDGIASFSRSGIAIVAGTASESRQSVTVNGVALSSTSLILATPQGRVIGGAVQGVVPDVSASSFTIHLTNDINVALAISWFVIG